MMSQWLLTLFYIIKNLYLPKTDFSPKQISGYAPVSNITTRAVLSQGGPRDAAVHFDTY